MFSIARTFQKFKPLEFLDEWVCVFRDTPSHRLWFQVSLNYGYLMCQLYGSLSQAMRSFAIGAEFLSFLNLEAFCREKELEVVPVVFTGLITGPRMMNKTMSRPTGLSKLGRVREGLVMYVEEAFDVKDFADCVCKSVRPNYVQTDEHWTRNWQPCRIKTIR